MRRPKIQKRLGYNLDTKLLIIHADDLGLCHGVNSATFLCLKKGAVNSASLMVNCPWFFEAVGYLKEHPEWDIGIHITITSEWDTYKWGPILSAASVPSLVDAEGFFWGHEFYQYVDAVDVEKEVRAQIDRALAFGFRPTHLDCHMNCLCLREDLFEIYVRLGEEYQLPIMVNREYCTFFNIDLDKYLNAKAPIVDKIYMARPENSADGVDEYYRNALRSMQPGLNVLLVHPGADDDEMNAISRNIYPWGAKWRSEDRDFFMSNECRQIIEAQQLELITWRELYKKLNATATTESIEN